MELVSRVALMVLAAQSHGSEPWEQWLHNQPTLRIERVSQDCEQTSTRFRFKIEAGQGKILIKPLTPIAPQWEASVTVLPGGCQLVLGDFDANGTKDIALLTSDAGSSGESDLTLLLMTREGLPVPWYARGLFDDGVRTGHIVATAGVRKLFRITPSHHPSVMRQEYRAQEYRLAASGLQRHGLPVLIGPSGTAYPTAHLTPDSNLSNDKPLERARLLAVKRRKPDCKSVQLGDSGDGCREGLVTSSGFVGLPALLIVNSSRPVKRYVIGKSLARYFDFLDAAANAGARVILYGRDCAEECSPITMSIDTSAERE